MTLHGIPAAVAIVLATFHCDAYCQRGEEQMTDPDMDFSVVPTPERSELQQFAMWFHQDWQLVFPDFLRGAAMYQHGLSGERKTRLKKELEEFLRNNERTSPEELKSKWVGLGAEAWQPGLDLRHGLSQMAAMM